MNASHKNRIGKPRQMVWSQLYIKIFECILLIPSWITTTGDI